MGAEYPPPSVRVEVLGPLQLFVDRTPVDVPGPKRRAVLALLALAEGRVVTADEMVDALWATDVPESGRQALHNHVSRLRAHLGPAASRLQTRHDGYRLALGGDDLDLAQARTLLTAARAAAPQDPAGAGALLRKAHGLWRGPALADLIELVSIAIAVEGFSQLHREVTDLLIATSIAVGQAETVLGLAADSVAADPLREPAVLLLMRAFAASGQAPEALRTARDYRRRLVEETGLDPSPAVGEVERDILSGTSAPGRARREAPGARLFGREAQVAALHRLLASERLVTLVGPGGVGKTRVAVEVARQSGGATVLSLAPVTDPAAIPYALAAALNLTVAQRDVLSACLAVLNDQSGLLVIDNCEHLLEAVRDTLDVILSCCPGLSVLTTSREPLGLADEYTSRLAPLPLPPGDRGGGERDVARVASVALFLDRARRVRPGAAPTSEELHTVVDIVRRLDGIPLAIELAAGRLSTFSLIDLASRLGRSLDLLGKPTGDNRHRTLRATIVWSYQLLAPEEQRLFRHLSLFVDGVDLATAERLAADLGLESDPGSVLARLVDASMIEARFDNGTRYHLLETLRAFGLDRLTATGEDTRATDWMLRWAVELAGWLSAAMTTDLEPEADSVLRRELPNLREAWRLARSRVSIDEAVAVVIGLFDAIAYRDLVEIRDWAEELAEDPRLASHSRASAVLGAAAEAAYHRGDYRRADRLARAGLENPSDRPGWRSCLLVLSVADLARGAYADAVEHSLAAAELSGQPREAVGIAALATAYSGDLDAARKLNARGSAGAASPTMTSWHSYVAGEIESLAGHSELAEERYLRAVDLARRSGATFLVGVATVGLLSVRAASGRVRQALSGYAHVIDYFERTGNWTHLWVTLRNLAVLLGHLGDEEPAALILAAADRAPDAPAVDGSGTSIVAVPTGVATPVPQRAAILDLAREAIERHLTRRPTNRA